MEIETCKFCNEGQIEIDEGCGIRVCTTCGRVEASFPNLVDRFDANVLQNPNLYDTIPLDECQFCESKKIHSLNLWGNSLGIPKNVLEEAKSIFVEIEMAHTPVTLPKDMLALFLIYVSGRKLHFPISLPQLAAAVGIRFCFFLKQLRLFLETFRFDWDQPSFIDFTEFYVSEIVEGCRSKAFKEMELESHSKFTNQCNLVSKLFVETSMMELVRNPVLLSAIGLDISWEICNSNTAIRSILCEKYGIDLEILKREHRKVRRRFVQYYSRIPGSIPGTTTRNVVSRLPRLSDYYTNIETFKTILEDASQSIFLKEGKQVESEMNRMEHHHTKEAKSPFCVSQASSLEFFHCDDVTDSSSSKLDSEQSYGPSQKEKEMKKQEKLRKRKERRKRGFDHFLEQANAKRKSEGRRLLTSSMGTCEITKNGDALGYCMSLPIFSKSYDLSAIRTVSFRRQCKKRPSWLHFKLQQPELTSHRGQRKETPSKEMTTSEIDSEIEEYILTPSEVRQKRIFQQFLFGKDLVENNSVK